MEYRHRVPTLDELRQNRKDSERKTGKPKSRLFTKGNKEELEALAKLKERVEIENDIIIAHLENQNELLLEMIRK
ncbi:MAG: hypothetical protein WAV25_00150, partial [Minisyncoccia bacterium]